MRELIEREVRFANISIIEGLGASLGSYQQAFGVTLSLPTVVGRTGAVAVLPPDLAPEKQRLRC